MFRFYLLKNYRCSTFTDAIQTRSSDDGVYYMKDVSAYRNPGKVKIQMIDGVDTDLSRKLKNLMDPQNGTTTQEIPNVNQRGLVLRDQLLDVSIDISVDDSSIIGFITIGDHPDGGNVLIRLQEAMKTLGLDLKAKVEIKDIRIHATGSGGGFLSSVTNYAKDVVTEEMDILEFTKDYRSKAQEGVSLPILTSDNRDITVLNRYPKFQLDLRGSVTIVCTVYPRDTLNQSRYLGKMMEEGTGSDVTIVASDGKDIKCHKFILIDQSDVFEAMFRTTSNTKESITGAIQMGDICSKSVKAFLAFLYLDEIGEAHEDSATALDLFKVGHRYQVPKLEKRIKTLLLTKPNRWFDLEVVMELYFFAKILPEDGEALKKKALGIMKSNHSALNASLAYAQLSKEKPEAAKELTADIVALQSNP